MAFKLAKGVFRVKCNYENCPFNIEFEINQNIMGVTEEDVENEAIELANDIAIVKHDIESDMKHELYNPTIIKIAGIYEALGTRSSSIINQDEAIKYKEYNKDDMILSKGDIATSICEVVKGSAYPNRNKSYVYNVGDSFGAASLVVNQTRTADVIAGEDGTMIAFYNLKELSKKDPFKAKELYNKAMEDIFDVLTELEHLIDELEDKNERLDIKLNNKRERIKSLEKELVEAHKKSLVSRKKKHE